jgi:tetratricopeptide (TPR) repeat protein
MDATRFHGLARLLPVVLVLLLTTTPALRAEESSTLVFTQPFNSDDSVEETAENPSSAASLVIVPAAKPQAISQPKRLQTTQAKPLPRPTTTLVVEPVKKKTPAPTPAAQLATQTTTQPQPAQRPTVHRDQRVQPVSYDEPIAEPDPEETQPVDTMAKLLVEAHELSQQAVEEQDYNEIIALCQTAKRSGVEGDQLEFTQTLMAWALNRRGQTRVDEGNQKLADADFQQALALDPDNWRALHNRGVSSAQEGKFAEALDDFNRVVELNPLFAKAFANRATLFTQSGDLEVALADYQRACRLDPKLLAAEVGRGRMCHLLGRWEEALDAFNKALEINPDNPELVCSRADLLADMGRYSEALADYARTIDLDPEFAHAYRNGAWLLATCPDSRYRDGANAVRGAERALESGYGERHVALDTLAAAQASAGQFDEAVQTLQDALKLAPHDARSAYRMRLRMYQAGKVYLTEPLAEVAQAVYEATDQ